MVGREEGRGEFALIADLFAPLTKDAAGRAGFAGRRGADRRPARAANGGGCGHTHGRHTLPP